MYKLDYSSTNQGYFNNIITVAIKAYNFLLQKAPPPHTLRDDHKLIHM